MSKFLSGRLRQLLVGITGYTENKTVLQTTGKVGIGTTDAQQHSLFVVGSTNITGDTIVGGGLTAVGIGSFQNDVYIDQDLYAGSVTVTGGATIGEDIVTRNLKATGVSTFVGITTVESTLFTNQLSVAGVSTISVNSSNDALRITQTGSGNALLVEDSSNPDTTPFVVAANGRVGIGTTNPLTSLDITGTISFGKITPGAAIYYGDVSIGNTWTSYGYTDGGFLFNNPGYKNNIFIGNDVYSLHSSGNMPAYNVVIGNLAGETLGQGCVENVIIGRLAGNVNEGNGNNFIGYQAGGSNLGGYFNNFIGYDAGSYNTTGYYNDFIGNAVGYRNTTGNNNFYGGQYTGYYNEGGDYNLALGSWAANGFSGSTTNQNYNVHLGSVNGATIGGSYQVLIGSGNASGNRYFDLPNPNKSYQFAVGIRTDANPSKYWLVGDENFNVGIGSTNPTAKLAVVGDANVSETTTTGQLIVSGVTTTAGLLDANGGIDAASAKVEDLTNDRIVLAGVGGELEDSPNLTFDGNTLNVVGYTELDNLNVSGIATINSLDVQTDFDVYDTTATFHNDLYVAGNLSIGGTTTVLQAQDLQIFDKDIILGVTTDSNGNDISTDITANHGGIAIASTEGNPLVPFFLAGVNEDIPDTYKQIMWVKSDSYGFGTTDAWLFNYAVGIGSTLVPNGVRLAVSEIQFTDDTVNTPNIDVGEHTELNTLNVSGVSTFNGTTEVKNSSFKVTNSIASGQYLEIIQNGDSSLNLNKVGVGAFFIEGNNIYLGDDDSSQTYAGFERNGKVYLNHNGITRLETTGYGVTIYNDLRVGAAVSIYGNAGIVSAISFYGDGSNLTNTGATLNATSGVERLVTTQLTSGTMVNAATDADLTFNAGNNTLNTENIKISGGISTDGSNYGINGQLLRSVSGGKWEWVTVPGIFSVNNILNGFNVLEEGATVGTAGSIHTLDFRGNNIVATADPQPNGIATITMSDTPTFDSLTVTGDLDVDGHTELDQLRVSGVSTFVGITTVESTLFTNQLSVAGIASVGAAITMYGSTGIISATAFYGDGSNLLNTGATLSAATGTQRLVLTSLTSGTMVDAATDGDLTFDANHNLLSVPSINVSVGATFGGTISAGGTTGTDGQYLQSTGVGVTWTSFPTLRTTQANIATDGQTSFNFAYNINFIDVFINGIKLTSSEYVANNGSTVVLESPAFGGDIVEFHSYNTTSFGGGGGSGGGATILNDLTDVTLSTLSAGQVLKYDGTKWINDTDSVGSVGAGGTWATDTVGINTTKNVGIGTTAKDGYKLYVEGDARVTGILTVGPASVTIDGINNEVTVGTGITLYGNTGIISATSLNVIGALSGDGSSLTGLTGASAATYGNGTAVPQITVDANGRITGITNVLISGGGGGGSSVIIQDSQSLVGAAGTIDFGTGLSVSPVSVGIVTVGINTAIINADTLNVSGVSTFNGDVHFNTTVADSGIFFDQDGASLTFKDDHTLVFGTSAIDGMIYSGTYNSVTGVHFRGTSTTTDLYRWGNFIVGPRLTSGHRLAIFKEKGTDGVGTDGGVELYYQDGSSPYNTAKRFETIGAGVTVTGTTFTNQLSVSGIVTTSNRFEIDYGNKKLQFGGSLSDSGNAQINLDNQTNGDLQFAASGSSDASRGNFIFYKKTSFGNKTAIATLYSDTGNLNVGGNVTASSFSGNGSGLTGITTTTAEWTLGANGTSDYTFTGPGVAAGALDPTIYLTRGQTYKFKNRTGSHPFRIQYEFQNTGGTAYTDGIVISDGSSASSGAGNNADLYWEVRNDAPDLLHYQCTSHTNMSGRIVILGDVVTNGSWTASAGTPQTIDTITGVANNDIKTAEYTVHIENGSNMQAQKVLVMQDGTTAYSQEYAIMHKSGLLVSMSATISGGNLLLQATPETGVSGTTTYKITRQTMR